MTKETVLITGTRGFLARYLIARAPRDIAVVGLSRTSVEDVESISQFETLSSWTPTAISEVFNRHHITAVIHAAGEANVDASERDVLLAADSNVALTSLIASAAREVAAHVVYISSNAVFSGTEAPYDDDATPSPVNRYGMVKLAGERVVLAHDSSNAILRPILMYGWPRGARPNPVSFTIEQLRAGKKIRMVDDVRENPLLVEQCADVIWAMTRQRTSGVVHAAGASTVNRYDLAVAVASAFDLDASLIERVDGSAFPSLAERPPDTTFRTHRMVEELQIEPMSLPEGLAYMRANET